MSDPRPPVGRGGVLARGERRTPGRGPQAQGGRRSPFGGLPPRGDRRLPARGPQPRVVRSVVTFGLLAFALAGCGSAAAAPIVDPPAARPAPPRGERHAPAPVRVIIPAIGVDAPLVRLGLDATRALEVPTRFDVAGWWAGGTRPGDRGPAVIAGHVDSKTGPAVFYRLPSLRRGDRVIVRRRDGSTVAFRVRSTAHYAKRRFPTRRVYGPTRRPELRLITCSGTFDRAAGHYLDNTVVYAA